MLKIAVNGISGRMGQAIFHLAKVKGHEVVAGFDIASSPYFGKDITELQLGEKKGVIINEIN